MGEEGEERREGRERKKGGDRREGRKRREGEEGEGLGRTKQTRAAGLMCTCDWDWIGGSLSFTLDALFRLPLSSPSTFPPPSPPTAPGEECFAEPRG